MGPDRGQGDTGGGRGDTGWGLSGAAAAAANCRGGRRRRCRLQWPALRPSRARPNAVAPAKNETRKVMYIDVYIFSVGGGGGDGNRLGYVRAARTQVWGHL